MQRAEQRLNKLFLVDGVGGDDEVKRRSKVAVFIFVFASEVPLRRKLGPVERCGLDAAGIGREGMLVECDVRLEKMGGKKVGCEDMVA